MTIAQHKHCLVCDKAISADKKFCSDRCQKAYEERLRRTKRYNRITTILIIVMIGTIVAFYLSALFS